MPSSIRPALQASMPSVPRHRRLVELPAARHPAAAGGRRGHVPVATRTRRHRRGPGRHRHAPHVVDPAAMFPPIILAAVLSNLSASARHGWRLSPTAFRMPRLVSAASATAGKAAINVAPSAAAATVNDAACA
jgi:hypothetical protein